MLDISNLGQRTVIGNEEIVNITQVSLSFQRQDHSTRDARDVFLNSSQVFSHGKTSKNQRKYLVVRLCFFTVSEDKTT